MISDLKVNVTVKIKWWVKPLINVIAFTRLPIDIDKLSNFIVKHGTKHEIKS